MLCNPAFSCYFCTTLQLHYSAGDSDRKLFNPSRGGNFSGLLWKNLVSFGFGLTQILGKKLLFFGLDFQTRSTRKPIKNSKRSDLNLVSTQNLSQKIIFSVWSPWHNDIGQKWLNLSHLWSHSQKNWNLKLPNFFNANNKTCRIFWGFEQLSSSIAWWVMELQRLAHL